MPPDVPEYLWYHDIVALASGEQTLPQRQHTDGDPRPTVYPHYVTDPWWVILAAVVIALAAVAVAGAVVFGGFLN